MFCLSVGMRFSSKPQGSQSCLRAVSPELCPVPLHFFLGASITGVPGPAGLPGPKGEKGMPGIGIGDPGEQGSRGQKGDRGKLAQVRPYRN